MWLLDCPIELLECDEVVDVIRQGQASPDDVQYVDGLPTSPHAPMRVPVKATLQPMNGRDLKLLPEGFRTTDSLSMWQPHQFNNTDVIRVDNGDIVLYQQKGYQVQSAKDWGSFTQASLMRINLGVYAELIAATAPSPPPYIYIASELGGDPIKVRAIPLGDKMANYLYDGQGAPPDNLGTVGDSYLDTLNIAFVGPKTEDGWPQPRTLIGPAGPRGNQFFYGFGPPPADVLEKAIAGDLYIDQNTDQLYPLGTTVLSETTTTTNS